MKRAIGTFGQYLPLCSQQQIMVAEDNNICAAGMYRLKKLLCINLTVK